MLKLFRNPINKEEQAEKDGQIIDMLYFIFVLSLIILVYLGPFLLIFFNVKAIRSELQEVQNAVMEIRYDVKEYLL